VTAACAHVEEEMILVGHSGAGLLVPAVAAAMPARISDIVFVEAALPSRADSARTVPDWLAKQVHGLAQGRRAPPWSQWWGPGAMESLVPDAGRRAEIESELPRLPLDYFEEAIPIPDGWSDRVACSYIWFSDPYRPDADEAAGRGWPVHRLPGGHLHMSVEPEAVTALLVEVVEATGGGRL